MTQGANKKENAQLPEGKSEGDSTVDVGTKVQTGSSEIATHVKKVKKREPAPDEPGKSKQCIWKRKPTPDDDNKDDKDDKDQPSVAQVSHPRRKTRSNPQRKTRANPNPPEEEQADADYEAKEHDGVVEDNEVNADDQDELQYQQVISRHQCRPPNIVDGLFGGGLLRGVLEFLPPADLAAAAMAYPPSKDLVRSLQHDEERHYIIQASRIHKCIKILQDTNIDTDNYDKIEVPDGGIALGEWVLIMNDDRDNWHDEEAHLDGYSGVAVKCVQDGGIIVVYALLAFFFDYGPLVLVKGTTESIFPYDRGNEILEDAGHPEFHYPRVSWWEMPPRNRAEMCEISFLDSSLNAEY